MRATRDARLSSPATGHFLLNGADSGAGARGVATLGAMNGPASPASGDRTRYRGGAPVTFDDLEVLACVYGPSTSAADLERMVPLGPGWARGIARWRAAGTAYLLLVAKTFDGGVRDEPEAVLADDRATLERAIWLAMGDCEQRLCLLESFEPSVTPFVRTVIAASRTAPGHA